MHWNENSPGQHGPPRKRGSMRNRHLQSHPILEPSQEALRQASLHCPRTNKQKLTSGLGQKQNKHHKTQQTFIVGATCVAKARPKQVSKNKALQSLKLRITGPSGVIRRRALSRWGSGRRRSSGGRSVPGRCSRADRTSGRRHPSRRRCGRWHGLRSCACSCWS